MDDLIVLLKVLNLLHDLFENFGAVLWRIAVFYKADMNESVLTSGAVSFFFIKIYTIFVPIAEPFPPLNTFSGIMTCLLYTSQPPRLLYGRAANYGSFIVLSEGMIFSFQGTSYSFGLLPVWGAALAVTIVYLKAECFFRT